MFISNKSPEKIENVKKRSLRFVLSECQSNSHDLFN